MGEVGENVLIDVSEVSLCDLLDEVDGSGLAWVLDRYVTPERDGTHFAFNNRI